MSCKVLWFDDQHHKLEIIRDQAFIEGIDLIGVSNAEEGIFRLKQELRQFDAVVVDGLFFRKSSHSGDNVTDRALDDVAKTIAELSGEKVIPWFILSGQTSFTGETNKFADVHKENKVYDKAKHEHLVQLWKDIKLEVEQSLDYQIKKYHTTAFDALAFLSLGPQTVKHLIEIIQSVSSPAHKLDSDLYFGQIRIILEHAFRHANTLGLVHDECLKGGKVNLTECSLFLSGNPTKHLGVKCAKPHFPKIIANSVASILFLVGSAAHTTEQPNPQVVDTNAHLEEIGTPYLLYSLTFQLLDILIWFKSYCLTNSDIAANKALWETMPTNSAPLHTGSIHQDGQGNYYCGPYLLPKNLKGYGVGDSIRVLAESANNSSTKFTYPKFASKFEKDI